MKIGIVGTGSVGCASAMAAVVRGSAREIVLGQSHAKDRRGSRDQDPIWRARSDVKWTSSTATTRILKTQGSCRSHRGVNENTGGATDRNDPQDRLRLLGRNAEFTATDQRNLRRAVISDHLRLDMCGIDAGSRLA
jgi:L-lactate dehydrogenase